MKKFQLLLLAFALVTMACGGGGSSADSDSANEAASESGGGSYLDQAKNAMKQMEETTKSLQEGRNVAVTDFRDLKAWLPEKISGLDRTAAEGETTSGFGINMSKAEAMYSNEEQRVQLEVIDFGGFQAAILGMAAWATYQVDRESDTEYERTTTIKGHKAFEKYNYEQQRGEINILTDRFIVNVRAYNLGEKEFQALPNTLELSELTKIKPKEK